MPKQAVYQCKACKSILSDSSLQLKEGLQEKTLVSGKWLTVQDGQLVPMPGAQPQVDSETFVVRVAVGCCECRVAVGHRILSTSRELDYLRGQIVLERDKLMVYELAGSEPLPTASPCQSGDEPEEQSKDFIVFKHGAHWHAADHEIAMLKSYCCVLHEAISDVREQLLALQTAVDQDQEQEQTQPQQEDSDDFLTVETAKSGDEPRQAAAIEPPVTMPSASKRPVGLHVPQTSTASERSGGRRQAAVPSDGQTDTTAEMTKPRKRNRSNDAGS